MSASCAVDPRRREDAVQRGAAVLGLALRPAPVLGREHRRRDRSGLVGREVRRARLLPQRLAVDPVPRRQRPAPVEDNRLHRHEPQHIGGDARGSVSARACRWQPRRRRRCVAPWASPGRGMRRGGSAATTAGILATSRTETRCHVIAASVLSTWLSTRPQAPTGSRGMSFWPVELNSTICGGRMANSGQMTSGGCRDRRPQQLRRQRRQVVGRPLQGRGLPLALPRDLLEAESRSAPPRPA